MRVRGLGTRLGFRLRVRVRVRRGLGFGLELGLGLGLRLRFGLGLGVGVRGVRDQVQLGVGSPRASPHFFAMRESRAAYFANLD